MWPCQLKFLNGKFHQEMCNIVNTDEIVLTYSQLSKAVNSIFIFLTFKTHTQSEIWMLKSKDCYIISRLRPSDTHWRLHTNLCHCFLFVFSFSIPLFNFLLCFIAIEDLVKMSTNETRKTKKTQHVLPLHEISLFIAVPKHSPECLTFNPWGYSVVRVSRRLREVRHESDC